MAGSGRPTVRDIARHAGVSVATVSRVTRDDPRVRPETRDRVQASIDSLGYTPSALGLSLAYQRHNTLGIILPGLGGPYFAELIQGVESVAVDAGIAVNVLGTHFRPDAPRAVRQLAMRTDGLVIQAGTVDDDLLTELASSLPVVLVAGTSDRFASVRTDGLTAERELTEHLIEVHGKRELRFVGDDEAAGDPAARYAGFRAALAAHGLTEAGPPMRLGLEPEFGARAARDLHAAGDVPEALVCANDELAFGLMATLPGLGYSIPRDVAITGFDDNSLAALASPTLTTVHQPTFELGATAAGLVLERPREGARSAQPPISPLAPVDRVLETRAVIRESCGCTA